PCKNLLRPWDAHPKAPLRRNAQPSKYGLSSLPSPSRCCQYANVTTCPPGVRNNLPKIAFTGLNITSVTPTVNVSGVKAPSPFGGGLGTTTPVYPLHSSSPRRKSTRPPATFFSTMAHFTPFSSSVR